MSISPEFLAVEYQAALARLQRIEDRLLLVGAGGLLLSAGAAAYTIGYRADLKLGYAWAGPLPFLVSAALLLALFSWRVAARRQLAALRQQAGLADPGPSPHAPLMHRLLLLPAAAMVILFGGTFLVGLRAIYTADRVAGLIYALVYLLASGAILLAGLSTGRVWKGQPALTPAAVRAQLLPYPAELLTGLGWGAAGFLAPALTVGLNAAQLPVINALFRRDIDFVTHAPLAAVMALGLAYLVVSEGLLVPAGLLWAALRRPRPAESGDLSHKLTYANIAFRLVLALALAFLLGGVSLLALALLIWLQQAVTAVLLAPYPRRARSELLWSALLPPLRFYAGVLAWVGPAWSFTHLLLLFCFAGFLGLGFEAARRARLARRAALLGAEPAPRLAYDLKSGLRWQRAAFLAALLTAAALTAAQALAEDCGFFNAYLAGGYGRCIDDVTVYKEAGLLNGLLLVFDLLALGALVCNLVVRLLRGAEPALLILLERLRAAGTPLLLAAAGGLVLAGFIAGLPSLAFGAAAALAAGSALWQEY